MNKRFLFLLAACAIALLSTLLVIFGHYNVLRQYERAAEQAVEEIHQSGEVPANELNIVRADLGILCSVEIHATSERHTEDLGSLRSGTVSVFERYQNGVLTWTYPIRYWNDTGVTVVENKTGTVLLVEDVFESVRDRVDDAGLTVIDKVWEKGCLYDPSYKEATVIDSRVKYSLSNKFAVKYRYMLDGVEGSVMFDAAFDGVSIVIDEAIPQSDGAQL